MPTNRSSLSAIARVLDCMAVGRELAAQGVPVDVIVHDNSCDPTKQAMLSQVAYDGLTYVSGTAYPGSENFLRALARSRGRYVMVAADDDVMHLPGVIAMGRALLAAQSGTQDAPAGACGTYLVDAPRALSAYAYKGLAAPSASQRLAGFFSQPGPNLIFYSAVRRDVFERFADYAGTHPVPLSFHDQMLTLMLLQAGTVVTTERVFYQYDMCNWTDSATGRATDARFVRAAGLDASLESILWVFGALEGAFLSLSPRFSYLSADEATRFAGLWFETKFREARNDGRVPAGGSGHATAAVQRFRAKWLAQTDADLLVLFADLVELLRDTGFARADEYFAYWNANLGGLLSPAETALATP